MLRLTFNTYVCFADYRKFKTAYEDAYQKDLAAYLVRSLPITPDVLDPVAELPYLELPQSMADENYDEELLPMMSTVVLGTRTMDNYMAGGGPAAWLDFDDE
jgi:hypothetical protein